MEGLNGAELGAVPRPPALKPRRTGARASAAAASAAAAAEAALPRSPTSGAPLPASCVDPSAPWWLFQTPDLFKDAPVFAEAEWERRRTWVRHLPTPRTFVRVLFGLAPVVLWVVLVTVCVGLYAEHAQPAGWPVAVSRDYDEPFLLSSFALALLLVFRTNSSYARWWEARQAWGAMLNWVRNLARMTLAWFPPEEAHLAAAVLRWDSALVAAAAAFLRADPSFLHAAGGAALSPAERAWLASCAQGPIAAMAVISKLLRRSAALSPFERATLESQLNNFDISLGACERIARQAIPLAYTRHTSRFVITYLTFLPFAMWDYMGWLTVPAMATLAFLLVGIENIGVQIEQPMWVLPLRSFADGAARAVGALRAEHAATSAAADAAAPGDAPP